MKKIWEFFENIDEMVYVSDADTYELVYMNRHLREALGCTAPSDYVGKKCHQLLQGFQTPCSFCTNSQLRPGQFLSWCHKNPILGTRFLIKDTLMQVDGRNYRMEIAINTDTKMVNQSDSNYARSTTILNQCMQQMFTSPLAEESIQHMLAYLGTAFSCDRSYIFEISDDTTCNTYEWCAEHVSPQQALLQNVPISAIDWWMDMFVKDEVTVIPDLEEIRAQHPEAYAILQPQDIHSLAAAPIKQEGQVVGFLGVDNPDDQLLPILAPLLNIIGYFTSTLLKRRDLVNRLNELSYHDQLTGALNRHALSEQYSDHSLTSAGAVYCDITGLKALNDTKGHDAGDEMIRRCYNLLRDTCGSAPVYRTGGDEFVVLFPNWDKQKFYDSVKRIQRKVQDCTCHLSLGHAWSEAQPLDLEQLVAQADQVMYQDKRAYYQANSGVPGIDRRKARPRPQMPVTPAASPDLEHPSTPFQTFLSQAFCDVESMFQSVSQNNDSSYFYVGDMQKDLYYISDNFKEDFGFSSNIVQSLLHHWSRRISSPEFQDLFWQDITGMLREKRTLHDLRYQVRDVHGNNIWIRCYGILKWNEDKTKPLFFSGRVTHQDKNFVVDPITNFPREHATFHQLDELQSAGKKALVIGFSFNGLTEINNTKGRTFGDRLLKRVADTLTQELSWKMSFYRLEGMRCMAIVHPACQKEGPSSLVEQIRSVVTKCYSDMDVSVRTSCSFGVMEYPNGNMTPGDLAENLISLIRVAKQNAKTDYMDYSAPNQQRIKQMSNMVLLLNQNVMNNMENFRIVVHPIVSAGSGDIIGGEVLLRWTFEGKDVSPAVFIPLLERENLIQRVGRWVFEQAVCTCTRLHAHNPLLYLTFNVSLQQLSDPLLIPFMRETLAKYQLHGSSLVAELTESCLDEQPERLNAFVQACQDMDLYIALDDFGSGYSSLRMLLQYPCSIIKLDQSLVHEVSESEAKMHFIKSIVYACHQFGKTVCMEGVEDAEQNEIILNTGCDLIQGYYYYRPTEVSQLYQLVSQNSHT